MQNLSPKRTVEELDRYIIGQEDAKKAVAVALRNRYRRSQLGAEMREEITPKNIILMGPTGVGKTEIARRLSKLVEAPFVKVEATKFTEVGYVGRDVESMVRDLVESSIHLVKSKQQDRIRPLADTLTQDKLIKLLVPIEKKKDKQSGDMNNPMALLMSLTNQKQEPEAESTLSDEEQAHYKTKKEEVAAKLTNGELEDEIVEVEVIETPSLGMDMSGMGAGISVIDVFGDMIPKKTKKRKVKVSEARKILSQQEMENLIDMDDVTSEALVLAEQHGIIFLDEIDKIAGRGGGHGGPDVSREGVQRDILPIVEGSTVTTKYGPIKTDFILFIAAGAFHVSKVSDLIPELQGRFPITVELKSLSEEDFFNILTQTDNAITKQYSALLKVDNINLEFTDEALKELSKYAYLDNQLSENIGARRLHTVMESLLSDISFNASGDYPETTLLIDENYVAKHLETEKHVKDLKKHLI